MSSSKLDNNYWGNLLDEIFKELENLKPKPCNYGFYREKEAHKFLKPKGRNDISWKLKKVRPIKVLKILSEEVLFILTSSKTGELFGCSQDYKYGFDYRVPKVNFSKCEAILEECNWIKPKESTVFRKPHKGFCLIWSLSKKVFEEFATICGKCEENFISDTDLRRWIEDEIFRYKNMILKKKRR